MKKRYMLIAILLLLMPISVFADCPLGPDVTKDLHGVLKILNIVAPIMCIGFSTYDLIRTIAKGDASSDMKKVAQKFGKRVVYTIILIFLPILVDQVMQIADVWNANGTCDLSAPADNGVDTSTNSNSNTNTNGSNEESKSETKKQACTDYKTYNECPATDIYGSPCYWDAAANACMYVG